MSYKKSVDFPIVIDNVDFADFLLTLSRQSGPIATFRTGDRQTFLINSPELIDSVFSNPGLYGTELHLYKSIASHFSPSGSLMLRLFDNKFSNKTGYEDTVATLKFTSHEILQRLAICVHSGKSIDFSHESKRWMLRTICLCMYEFDITTTADQFILNNNFIEECFTNLAGTSFASLHENCQFAVEECRVYFQDLASNIHNTRMTRAPNKANHSSPQLSTDESHDAIIRTLINGFNAAATTLSWTIYLLSIHQDVQNKIFDESYLVYKNSNTSHIMFDKYTPLLKKATRESMRLYPAAWLLGRKSLRTHVVDGVTIPQDAPVAVCAYSMHRDPKHWSDPDRFIPERLEFENPQSLNSSYIPFGGGVHKCPSSNYVIPIINGMISLLIRSFHFELDPDHPCRPRGLIGLRADPGVWIKVTAR